MPILGQKRRRSYRDAGPRPTSFLKEWLPRIVQDRAIFVPLCIAIVGVIGMACAVQGWKSNFPYRLGARVDRALIARVTFARVNLSETEKAKAEAENSVNDILVNDRSKLKDLPALLGRHLQLVSNAKTLDDVPDEVRQAFGLQKPAGASAAAQPDSGKPEEMFKLLQAAIAGEDGSAGKRIGEVVKEFDVFIADLKKYGRASPAEVARLHLSPGDTVTIVTENRSSPPVKAAAGDIILEEALKDSGILGRKWKQQSELINIRGLLKNWLLAKTPVTLHYDKEATEVARRKASENQPPVLDTFEKGQQLVRAGDVIDDESLSILRSEYEAYEGKDMTWSQRIARMMTVVLLLTLLAVLLGYFLVENEPRIVRSPVRLAIYVGMLIAAVFLGRLLVPGAWRAEVIPLTVTVMVLAVAYDQRLALITALALALILVLSTTADITHFVVLMAVLAATVVPLAEVPSRSSLIKVGFLASIVYFLIAWSTEIVWSQAPGTTWGNTDVLLTSLRGAGCCLVAGYLVAGSLPFIESAFDVVTDISLLEMSDVSHPLLQELARRAPGTYNHSISVATIGEAAADAIRANGLLVRIGAYFHDIGKMLKPEYFIENVAEGAESRHKKLAPAMSTLIIIGHVKDGVDLARQHNLPQSIVDFIEQHHGTTLVEYFYHEATKQVEQQPDHKSDAEESAFRYPGPKPQTKEAGVMMLADAVESASRTLSDPTAKRIEGLVKAISMKKLLDDQFDECSLTLSEIRIVEESLIKSLIAIHHGRIQYPEQRTA